jgi:two-component system, NarL family, response regulator NreC
MIQVFLADDHDIVLHGIRGIVEKSGKDIVVSGTASDGMEVLEKGRRKNIDVYLLDVSMPKLSGLQAASELLKWKPTSSIILLSMYQETPLIEQAFEMGIKGYILKNECSSEVVNAILAVYKGGYWISPCLDDDVLLKRRNGNDNPREDGSLKTTLTIRQIEVLNLVCEGYTERGIAERLDISPHTVHVHKNTIMKKLDIHSKAELVKYALRHNLIQVREIQQN